MSLASSAVVMVNEKSKRVDYFFEYCFIVLLFLYLRFLSNENFKAP